MFLRVLLLVVVVLSSDSIAQNTAPKTPIPPDCNRPGLLKQGHPVFISDRRSTDFNKLKLGLNRDTHTPVLGSSLAYGVSLEKYVFEEGEPIRFHIWVDNPSGQAAFTLTCSDLEWFAENDFHLYDAKGRRMESHSESTIVARFGAKSLTDACASIDRYRLEPQNFCLLNVPTEIPPHTCKNTGDENTDESFRGDLRNMYDLPVGRYTIRPHTEATVADPCKPESSALWYGVPGQDITFEVIPQQPHR
jgi:hypothetical protein